MALYYVTSTQAKRASAVRAKVNLREDIREDNNIICERAQECSRSFGEQFAKFFLHCTVGQLAGEL